MIISARPVGPEVQFEGVRDLTGKALEGAHVRLEPMQPEVHGPALWPEIAEAPEVWDYLYEPPPADEAELVGYLTRATGGIYYQGFAVCLPEGDVVGYAYYLNHVAAHGTIEVGNINFSPRLQRTVAATEAMFLMMRAAFEAGFRRYEWKCNALNMPSRRAAQRLGFSWEGIFRNHLIVKGRNRDTAWLGITDQEWPALRGAFETWLSPDNFDAEGRQKQSLASLTAPHRVASDPGQT